MLVNEERIKFGEVTLFTYPGEKSNFVLVSISWSQFIDYIEDILHVSTNPFGGRIAPWNKRIKEFMNDGFADAVLYLNPQYKSAIHSVIKKGIEKAYVIRPELNGNANVLISTSLGSKIVFDMINDKDQINAYSDFRNNMKQIFMTSNQIPLLDLYRKHLNRTDYNLRNLMDGVGVEEKDKKPSPTLTEMNEALKTNSINITKGEGSKLPIIAFTDPNDALSYYIKLEMEKIEFINVTISHAKWWWLVM